MTDTRCSPEQVTWLVVAEIRSDSFGLVHRAPSLQRTSQRAIVVIVECGIARFLCAMHVIEVRASSSSPIGCLCGKFRFFRGLHCWASPWRKIAYSISHSASSSFDAHGTEAFASENQYYDITSYNCYVNKCTKFKPSTSCHSSAIISRDGTYGRAEISWPWEWPWLLQFRGPSYFVSKVHWAELTGPQHR